VKVNSNIIIFIILTIFITSNAFLYRYLNNDYFIDKKPTVKEDQVENVIFSLIAAHEKVLLERNAEIEKEAEMLRNRKLTITDSAELKAIEEKLRSLELESQKVLDSVKNSENERAAAEKKAENNQLQLTELMKENSRMGAQLEGITKEFDNYVSTLADTLKENSFSEKDISSINAAFRKNRGLDYLNDLVGNIQSNRTAINMNYTKQLQDLSDEYHNGLQQIAQMLNRDEFQGVFNDKGLIDTNSSIIKLKNIINNYLETVAKNSELKLNQSLKEQEKQLLDQLQNELELLKKSDEIVLKDALDQLLKSQEELRNRELELAKADKEESLKELEERLKEEMEKNATIVQGDIATPDTILYTSWLHIPKIWESSSSRISFSGKEVESIAWSRNSIEDNMLLSFNANIDSSGELLINLYGNGKFKNWDDGITISVKNIGENRILTNVTSGGISEKSKNLLSNSTTIEEGLSGDYYISVIDGKLTMVANGKEIIKTLPLSIELQGKIGIGNRAGMTFPFELSNIRLIKVQ